MSTLQCRARRAFTLDVRSLALYRVAIGLVMMVDLYDRYLNYDVFYTDEDYSLLPLDSTRKLHYEPHWMPSIYMYVGQWQYVLLVMGVHAAVTLAFTVGWNTRLSTILCWYLQISVQQRAHTLYYGYDCLLRLLLFFSIFLPLGERFSMDNIAFLWKERRYRRERFRKSNEECLVQKENREYAEGRRRQVAGALNSQWHFVDDLEKGSGGREGDEEEGYGEEEEREERVVDIGSNWIAQRIPGEEFGCRKKEDDCDVCRDLGSSGRRNLMLCGGTVCIILQVFFVYFITFERKYGRGNVWKTGEALELTLQLDLFKNWPAAYMLNWVPSVLLRLMGQSVLVLEATGCFLLFSPWYWQQLRLLCVALFFSLHLGFFCFLRVGFFPWGSMASFLVFLPPSFWSWATRFTDYDSVAKAYNVILSTPSSSSPTPRKVSFRESTRTGTWSLSLPVIHYLQNSLCQFYLAHILRTMLLLPEGVCRESNESLNERIHHHRHHDQDGDEENGNEAAGSSGVERGTLKSQHFSFWWQCSLLQINFVSISNHITNSSTSSSSPSSSSSSPSSSTFSTSLLHKFFILLSMSPIYFPIAFVYRLPYFRDLDYRSKLRASLLHSQLIQKEAVGQRYMRPRGRKRKRSSTERTCRIFLYHVVPGLCLGMAFGFMVMDLTPKSVLPLVHFLRLEQRWLMFAPPPRVSTYFAVEGISSSDGVLTLFSCSSIEERGAYVYPEKSPYAPPIGGFVSSIYYYSHRTVRFLMELSVKRDHQTRFLQLAKREWCGMEWVGPAGEEDMDLVQDRQERSRRRKERRASDYEGDSERGNGYRQVVDRVRLVEYVRPIRSPSSESMEFYSKRVVDRSPCDPKTMS